MIRWSAVCRIFVPSRADALIGLGGMLLGAILGFNFILWGNRASPIVIYSAFELADAVDRAGHIDIFFDIDRVRDCPSQTSRWLWTWVEKDNIRVRQYFPLANSSLGITNAGKSQQFILSLQLPPGVWPGDWFYTSKTVEQCPILPGVSDSRILQSPNVPIRIVDSP